MATIDPIDVGELPCILNGESMTVDEAIAKIQMLGTSESCMCDRLAAAELAAQILADGVSEEAEATADALTTARIDGARAFAEWLDANMDIDVLSFVEAVDRWLASESKEG